MALVSTAPTVPEILPGAALAVELVPESAARNATGVARIPALKKVTVTNLTNDIFMFYWVNLAIVRTGLVMQDGYRLGPGFTSKMWMVLIADGRKRGRRGGHLPHKSFEITGTKGRLTEQHQAI